MTLVSFFGDLLVAWSPAIVILVIYIGRHASLVLLTLAGAFFWLLSALFASLIWFAAVPIRGSQPWTIFTGVATQELARWALFVLLGKAEKTLEIVATHGPGSALNESVHAFTAGLSFGVINGLVTYTTLLVSTIGPAYIFSKPCPGTPMSFVAAVTTNIFILLNIAWALVSFEGYRKGSIWRIALVVLSHFGASYSTLFLSSTIPYGCVYGNIVPVVILIPLAYLAWKDLEVALAKEKARLAAMLPPPPPPDADEDAASSTQNGSLAAPDNEGSDYGHEFQIQRTGSEPYRRPARGRAE